MPPTQLGPRQKKMLAFPFTRHASAGKQAISIAMYSALMLVLFAGSVFFLYVKSLATSSPFVNPNGTVDSSQILVFLFFIFLILPATTLLSGALFGAVRAFLVTCIVTGGTASLWLVYLSTHHMFLSINNTNSPATVALILMPFTATLVGTIYDRRQHAAWWKSFLTLLLGSAFFVIAILVATIIWGRPTSSSQATLADFFIGIGCVGILLIPLMALPVAGIEGMLHTLIVAQRKKSQ